VILVIVGLGRFTVETFAWLEACRANDGGEPSVRWQARLAAAPVRFAEALCRAARDADLLIEVGPGHGLTRIVAASGGPPCIALDAGGPSLAGLLLAAGAAFVLGCPVKVPALFADRFTRDFDLDRPRRFQANPCEAAPVAASSSPRNSGSKPAPSVRMPAVASRGAAISGGRTALDVLRGLLARRMELDPALIEPAHRLLGDLHLNSIAVGQIVGEAARLLGRAPPPTPTNFAAATVAEAAAALEAVGLLADDASERFPPGVATWIRCFATEYVERRLPFHVDVAPHRWRVFAPAEHPLFGTLAPLASCDDAPTDAVAVCLSGCASIEDQARLLDGARSALANGSGALLMVLPNAAAARSPAAYRSSIPGCASWCSTCRPRTRTWRSGSPPRPPAPCQAIRRPATTRPDGEACRSCTP
jgi:enediyne polyketide synthase